jgi:hypothetical protein
MKAENDSEAACSRLAEFVARVHEFEVSADLRCRDLNRSDIETRRRILDETKSEGGAILREYCIPKLAEMGRAHFQRPAEYDPHSFDIIRCESTIPGIVKIMVSMKSSSGFLQKYTMHKLDGKMYIADRAIIENNGELLSIPP